MLKETKLGDRGGVFIRVLLKREILGEVDGSGAILESHCEMRGLRRRDGGGSDRVDSFVADM